MKPHTIARPTWCSPISHPFATEGMLVLTWYVDVIILRAYVNPINNSQYFCMLKMYTKGSKDSTIFETQHCVFKISWNCQIQFILSTTYYSITGMNYDLLIYCLTGKHDSDFTLLKSATKSSPLCPFARGSLGNVHLSCLSLSHIGLFRSLCITPLRDDCPDGDIGKLQNLVMHGTSRAAPESQSSFPPSSAHQ